MLRALGYDPSGVIYFKTNINDEYQLLPQRAKVYNEDTNPGQLYEEKIPLSKKKWEHLQDLKKFLPKDCHYFYDELPHKT